MATKKTFNFRLGQEVRLEKTEEVGKVISRSHSLESEPQYHVRSVGKDGLREVWWSESALVAVPETTQE